MKTLEKAVLGIINKTLAGRRFKDDYGNTYTFSRIKYFSGIPDGYGDPVRVEPKNIKYFHPHGPMISFYSFGDFLEHEEIKPVKKRQTSRALKKPDFSGLQKTVSKNLKYLK